MLTGNKGEWSEVYVLLKLLSEGVLFAADKDLEKLDSVFYPIIKILRKELTKYREFHFGEQTEIFDEKANLVASVQRQNLQQFSKLLFNLLLEAKGSSFGFPDVEEFLKSMDVRSLTASRKDKSDIRVVVHDIRTNLNPELGFSIKSLLGKNATLFNAGQSTNFIYEISGERSLNLVEINSIIAEPRISNRIGFLRDNGFDIKFSSIQSENFFLNLKLIDSDLPNILAEMLLLKYSKSGKARLDDLLKIINETNPLNYNVSLGHPFYEHKLMNFLTDAALGMVPSALWTGIYDATGGIIIVKKSGDLVCYHIYNRAEFQRYLIKNTRLEQADTGRYKFGEVYETEGRYFIKLNLQIRFD